MLRCIASLLSFVFLQEKPHSKQIAVAKFCHSRWWDKWQQTRWRKFQIRFRSQRRYYFLLNRAKITLLLLFEIYANSVKVYFLFENAKLELYLKYFSNLFPIFQIPMLMKATSDDDNPTSGYIYQEVNSIFPA